MAADGSIPPLTPLPPIPQATEMRLEVAEVLRDKERMLEGYSRFTGRSIESMREDFKRDFYLNAYEASQVSRCGGVGAEW